MARKAAKTRHRNEKITPRTLSDQNSKYHIGGAAVDAYKIIRKRSIYKTMHHEKACNAQGRNFMPWVHTIMGDTGPEV